MKKLLLILAMVFTLSVAGQVEDTTTKFDVVVDEQLISDQLYMSFKQRTVGMLPLICEDSLDFMLILTPEDVRMSCMSRAEVMEQMYNFYETMWYQGFRMYSGDMVEGHVVFIKVYMDTRDPTKIVHFFFGFDPETHKINKVLIE